MTAPLDRLDWKPAPTVAPDKAHPSTSPLRDPARAITVLGAALMLLGCCMPWATGIDGLGHNVGYSASGGLADGVLIIVAALAIAVLVGHPIALDSRSRSFQVTPLVLASICAVVWVSGAQSARATVQEWVRGGGSGNYAFGLWVTLIGIGIAARGSAWVDERRPAQVRAETSSLRQEWAVGRSGAIEGTFAVIGGLLGAGAGLATAGLIGNSLGLVLIVVLATIGGLVVGAGIGVRLGRFVVKRLAVQ